MLSQPKSQRAAAAKLTPHLDSQSDAKPSRVKLRARVYVAREYGSVQGWREQLDEQAEEANRMLQAELGAQLEIESAPRDWALASSTDTLDGPLAALTELDSAEKTDFVIGLVSSQPKLTFSFHELGVTRLFGKHLVLRGANDAAEFDAIERDFPALSASERQKLYRARRRHKAAAVLLHELGHALGAPHARDAHSVLSAHYSPEETGYGKGEAAYLEVALEHRAHGSRDERPMASALAKELDRHPDLWATAERDDLSRQLHAFGGVGGAAPAQTSSSSNDAAPEELAPSDRELFQRAKSELASGDSRTAWQTAEPLFARYPKSYAVQDLRCSIAMNLGMSYQAVKEQCSALMQLTPWH